MSDRFSFAPRLDTMAIFLRVILLLLAATLAFYIPFKYATQLHAATGIYAFLFPLSGLLAIAGITLSVKPQTACDCSTMNSRGRRRACGWMDGDGAAVRLQPFRDGP